MSIEVRGRARHRVEGMRNRVIAALLTASLGWGFAAVGTRAAFGLGATTLTVLTTRTLIALGVLVAWVILAGRWPSRAAWQHGALIGVFRTGLGPLVWMNSLNYISAGVQGLVITLVPSTTAVLAAVMIKERITRRQVIGLGVGLVGTSIIALSGSTGLGDEGDVVYGFALAGIGVFFGAFAGVFQRKFAPLHDTVELAMPMFASGALVALVVGAVVGFGDLGSYPANMWLLLAILAMTSTLMPFALTLYASKHASATIVSMTGYIAPVIAVVAGAVLLGEEITGPILFGAALAAAGVAIVGGVRRSQT